MCFYDDGDGIPVDWMRETIIIGRKVQACASCQREIAVGEQHVRSAWRGDGEFEDRRERGEIRICNQCCQNRVTIHRHELRVGCRPENSWCPWEEIEYAMRHGNDEFREEFDGDCDGGAVLFWPYGLPPAVRPVDLKNVPELAESLITYG